jgi:hypothetical protein
MRSKIAIALLMPAICQAQFVDCTTLGLASKPSPKAEPVIHHITRIIHNVLHPHHKAYPPIVPITYCGLPQIETVTVEASPSVVLPSDPNSTTAGFGTVIGDGGGFYATYIPEPVPLREPPHVVPEPAQWMVFVTSMLGMFLIMRKRGKHVR